MDRYRLARIRECFLAEAALCDRIGAAAADNAMAIRCRQAAEEARAAAAAIVIGDGIHKQQ